LPPEDRERIKKALGLLDSDWRHPSLHVKRVQGTRDIWEARASRSLRLTFNLLGDLILLRNVGLHDETLANP
jgi:hypothetical protein